MEIKFKDSNGVNLVGDLTEVNQDKSSRLVILCHGFTSNRKGSTLHIANSLNKEGVNTFTFDFFGHGDSEGNFSDITVSKGIDGILSAITYLKTLNFSNLGLIGSSFGGACAILAASRSKDVSLLALKAPVSDYYTRNLMTKTKEDLTEWKEKGLRIHGERNGVQYAVKYNFMEDIKQLHGFEEANRFKYPTLIVHGDNDTQVPLELSIMLHKAMDVCDLKIIEGADHSFTNKTHMELCIKYITDFIVEHSS